MLTKEEYIKMLEHIRTLEEAVQNESAITEKVRIAFDDLEYYVRAVS